MTKSFEDFPRLDLGTNITIGMSAYGNVETTQIALQQLFNSTGGDFELILVDDCSPDNGATRSVFEQVRLQHRNTRLFVFDRNLEYSGSLNAILSHATGDWILFISNDIFVTPAYLRELLDIANSDPRYGIVRGCSNFVDGCVAHQNVAPKRQIENTIDLFAEAQGIYSENHGKLILDEFLTGDAFLVSRAVVEKVGTLDPVFYGYFADPDYGLRAQQAGFELVCALGAFAWHDRAANLDYLDAEGRQKKLQRRRQRVFENWARFKAKYELPAALEFDSGMDTIPWAALRQKPFAHETVYRAPGDYSRSLV